MRVEVRKKGPVEVPISTEFIKLQSFLKLANIAESGGMAKQMILDGLVSVDGEPCLMRGKKLVAGMRVRALGHEYLVTCI